MLYANQPTSVRSFMFAGSWNAVLKKSPDVGTVTVPDGAVTVCAAAAAGMRRSNAATRIAELCRNLIGLCKTHTLLRSRGRETGAFGVVK